jgi:hypothetical protein
MTRSLDAPLSPNEEATLRQVANGITTTKHLPPDHVRRLKHLALVEESGGGLRLTTAGRQRHAALPKTDDVARLPVDDDFARKFAKYLGRSRL